MNCYFNYNQLSIIKNFTFLVLFIFLTACGGSSIETNKNNHLDDSNTEIKEEDNLIPTNNEESYLERDNATVKNEQGEPTVYYKNQLFTGTLVFTDDTKQAVTTLENIKNGKSLGTHTHHSGSVTTGFITTLSGNKLRVLRKDEEVTTTKTMFYNDETGEIEYEAEGYIKDGEFIEDGKATSYEDGEIVEEEIFEDGESISITNFDD